MVYRNLDNIQTTVRTPKVLLLNPPDDEHSYKLFRASFPLGLCYLGTYLKKEKYQVKIVDAKVGNIKRVPLEKEGMVRVGLSLNEIENIINDFSPDVLGLSCIFHTNFNPTLDIAKLAKTKCHIPYVVAGGSYASVVPKKIMESPYIDYLVLGEGEVTFEKLLQKLFNPTGNQELGDLDGVVLRDNDGKVCVKNRTEYISSDEFFTPNRDFLPVEKYIKFRSPHNILSRGHRALEVITSRGCNARCTFCSAPLLWGKFRMRSVKGIIDELKFLKEKYHIDEVQFIDDNLTFDKKRAEDLFQRMIDDKLNLKWCAPNGIAIHTLDENLIRLMKESGCYLVTLAIESGSQRVLTELIKKPLLLEKVHATVKLLKKYKLAAEAFFVIGMPGETFEEIKKTFDLAFKLGIFRAHFSYITPIPSTPVYKTYLELKRHNASDSSTTDLIDESCFDFRFPAISTKEWTNKQLKRYTSILSFKFYLKFLILKPHIFIKEVSLIISRPKLLLGLMVIFKDVILGNLLSKEKVTVNE
ncbi:MAG: radical SAM protein [Candidatus Omnitrophota bacterium]